MQPIPGTEPVDPGSMQTPAPHLTGLLGRMAASPSDDIRELQGVEPLPVPGDEFPWLEAGIGVGIALLLALLIYYVRRRRRPPPIERREAAARRRLAALAALDAPDPRTFHVEMAQVLRDYIEASLGVSAQRLTSREMVESFRGNGHMTAQWQSRLEALLARCDRAKFSREPDAEWDPRATALECREVLDALVVAVAAASRLASPWETWKEERAS